MCRLCQQFELLVIFPLNSVCSVAGHFILLKKAIEVMEYCCPEGLYLVFIHNAQ